MRKTLLWRPTERAGLNKAGFYGVSGGGKSRLLPALSVPARNGGKRPILPKVGAGPRRGGPEGRRERFLDGKRGFLTAFAALLSVLFGAGIRSAEDRIPSCSGTPFLTSRLGTPLFYPLNWPKPAKRWPETSQKVANIQPFCHLLTGKTVFWSPFVLRDPIQAAPLIDSGKKRTVTFHRKVTEKGS